MKIEVGPSALSGTVVVPGSKSHTIRGLLLGALAGGTSVLRQPLRSRDTESCVAACRALGATVITDDDDRWEIGGTAGRPRAAPDVIDVGNSGTTLYLAMCIAALCDGQTEFIGDEQIQRRSAAPLLEALSMLGATAHSRSGNGCVPIVVGGGLKGGLVSIECPTSQYLSGLLMSCPRAGGDTVIVVPLLNERPYVAMTRSWLDAMGVRYAATADMSQFVIPGRQSYRAFDRAVPGDWSSATFFMVAAATTGSSLFLRGLEMADTQGDKAVAGMLKRMGCAVATSKAGLMITGPDSLRSRTIDLNATPDALPALAVAACAAEGETRLVNVPQARAKETDRIAAMACELARLGADVEELPDGLVVRGSALHGGEVDGHDDHRIVMALAVAGLFADDRISITGAEAVSVTFPNFVELMAGLGADIREVP